MVLTSCFRWEIVVGGLLLLFGILIGAWAVWKNTKTATPAPTKTAQATKVDESRALKEPVVYELDDKDLPDIVAAKDMVIVLFYAPWCGYCKKMFPEFDQAAANAVSSGTNTTWAQLDATKFPELAKQMNVSAFPTTIVFSRGQLKQVVPGAQDATALAALAK